MDKALAGKSIRFSQKIRPTYALANPLAPYYAKAVIAEGKATVKLPDQLLAIVRRNKK